MILLPNVSGDLSKYRLDELLLYLLVKSAVRLSIVDLTKQLNTLGLERSFGVRGVRRSISLLCEKGLLDSTHDLKRHCTVYTVNPVVLRNGVRQGQQKLRSCDLFGDIYRQRNEIAFSHSVTFDDLRSADDFVDEFEQFWAEQLRSSDDRTVFHNLLYNRACLSNVFQLTDLFRDRGIVHYVLCQDKRFISRKKEGRWLNRQAFIRLGVAKKQQWDTVVLGSYIITIRYSNALLSEMERVYSEAPAGEVLQQLWRLRGEIVVTLRKDRELSDLLTEAYGAEYPAVFHELFSDLQQQISQGMDVVDVDGRFQYLLPSQLNVLLSNEEVSSGNKPWMLSTNKTNFIVQKIPEMLSYLDSSKPVVFVDLGVGPMVRPIPFLSALNKQFPEVSYVGVDYSEEVNAHAKEQSEKYLSSVVQSASFITTDFIRSPDAADLIHAQAGSSQCIYAMIGSTFSNQTPAHRRTLFDRFLREGDIVIVDIEMLDTAEDYEQIAARYQSPSCKSYDTLLFRELGFPGEAVQDLSYAFNQKTWCVEGNLQLSFIPDHLPNVLKKIGIDTDTILRVFKSWKPNENTLKSALEYTGKMSATVYRGDTSSLRFYGLAVGSPR